MDEIALLPEEFDDIEEWLRYVAEIAKGGKSLEYDPEQLTKEKARD